MIVDKNVAILFLPNANITGTEDLDAKIFYFPSSTVTPSISKNISQISMIGISLGLDLYRSENSVQITGTWRDDHQTALYDGLTSLQRVHLFYLLNTKESMIGWFQWSSGGTVVTYKVLGHELDCDQESGKGDLFTYNFNFAIIDLVVGEESPVFPT